MGKKQTTLSMAISEYENFLAARGLAASTRKGKRTSLNHLQTSIGRDIYVASISHQHIDTFASTATWKASTFNNYKGHLSEFLNWCTARGYRSGGNPVDMYTNRKVIVTEKTRVPVHDWWRLFAACEHPMDRMFIALGLFLFLRGSESTFIQMRHIHLDEDTIEIFRVKTSEWDTMPIPNELRRELVRYLRWYEEKHGTLKDDWYLLAPRVADYKGMRDEAAGKFGKGVDPDARLRTTKQIKRAYVYVQPILDRAGIETDGEGAHTLRRSGARALFDELRARGYDGALRRVQSMLGHKSAKMTEVYLGIGIEKMQRNEDFEGKDMFSFDVFGDEVAEVVSLDARRSARGEADAGAV